MIMIQVLFQNYLSSYKGNQKTYIENDSLRSEQDHPLTFPSRILINFGFDNSFWQLLDKLATCCFLIVF